MGECPDWYPLMRAARWLHVEPWVLADQPQYWTDWALIADAAEDEGSKFTQFFKSIFGG